MTRVFLLVTPESFASGVIGPHDLLKTDDQLLRRITGETEPMACRFQVEVVGPAVEVETMFERRIRVDRTLDDARNADVVYIPPLAVLPDEPPHFDTQILDWLRERFQEGAQICSACTGTLLMAATGMLNGERATTHWAYERLFRHLYPEVDLQVNRTLVVAGRNQQLVTAGAHASWHDLMLYILHRHAGAATARQTAKAFLLDWHDLDQNAYATFRAPMKHGDPVILEAQAWLAENLADPNPVENVIEQSGLAKRSFLRRFRQATEHTPIQYTQHLRVEAAKCRLENSDEAIEEISWQVGYEDLAYFRRLFKRVTGLTPTKYRKSFRTPPNIASELARETAHEVAGD